MEKFYILFLSPILYSNMICFEESSSPFSSFSSSPHNLEHNTVAIIYWMMRAMLHTILLNVSKCL
jgi:hypothetical protein